MNSKDNLRALLETKRTNIASVWLLISYNCLVNLFLCLTENAQELSHERSIPGIRLQR